MSVNYLLIAVDRYIASLQYLPLGRKLRLYFCAILVLDTGLASHKLMRRVLTDDFD